MPIKGVKPKRSSFAKEEDKKPVPPKKLKVGKMYRFTPRSVKEGYSQFKGTVVGKYKHYYLVETMTGYHVTIHNYAVDNDINVAAL